MSNNITREDLDVVIKYLQQDDPHLTQSANVRAFENEWSQWLGVKHSVFVNSGSSANLLTMAALRLRYPEGGEVIVPPFTWVSDIAAVLQAGFTPVFIDIDLYNLGMNTKKTLEAINEKTRAVFITHAQGFNALTDELLDGLNRKKVLLIEDVCESHGASHGKHKLGSFGWASNFSFYYAHHMTTIEGGMLCTNDSDLYQTFRMLRSHGMVRESSDQSLKDLYHLEYPDLNPDFIFAFPAFNVRNTEIGGLLGRNQLLHLDKNNKIRNQNLKLFLSRLDPHKYITEFRLDGCSNYAFNLLLREADNQLVDQLIRTFKSEKIEFRRGSAGGGNQLRQPYLRKILGDEYEKFPNANHVHFYGFYIGNYPSLEKEKILQLCDILNKV